MNLNYKIILPFVGYLILTVNLALASVEFDLQPLGNLNKILVSLKKGEQFGLGQVQGSFSRVQGKINFDIKSPAKTVGKIILDARSLRFGYHKVDGDAHQPQWLNSEKQPKISFQLEGLSEENWKGNTLGAKASGTLLLKNTTAPISFPVTIKYLCSKRKKFDGKPGDLLYFQGNLSLSRGNFGINPGNMLGIIQDQINVEISLIACSSGKRPLLPSRLFI
ncbi:MAG: YceI family protein [Opitutae bacterium]|nr:YceI family protein [Opitutae bacterium]